MSQDGIAALEAWKHGHKSRSILISHDDGYGAHCGWECTLRSGTDSVTAIENGCRTDDPTLVVLVDPDDEVGDEWPGLTAVILAAIERANELGL